MRLQVPICEHLGYMSLFTFNLVANLDPYSYYVVFFVINVGIFFLSWKKHQASLKGLFYSKLY